MSEIVLKYGYEYAYINCARFFIYRTLLAH